MCGYLNWATQQATEPMVSMAGYTQVSRALLSSALAKPPLGDEKPQVLAAITEPVYKLPLNLTIPSATGSSDSETLSTTTSKSNWFERSQTDKVRYGAQLLFDSEEGTTIRGGQVNITIPMG